MSETTWIDRGLMVKGLIFVAMFSAGLVAQGAEAADRQAVQLSGSGDFAALESKPDDAAAVAGVNTVLKKAFADSRLVCTFEQALGSNMKKRQCMTAAARKRVYDTTQQTLQGRDRNDSVHIQ